MAKKKDEQIIMDGVKPPVFAEQKTSEKVTEPQIDPNQVTIDDFIGESILERDTVNTLLSEAVESQEKPKKKKRTITNLIFLAINIILMVFIVKNLLDSATGSLVDVFIEQGKRMWWLAVGLGLLILFYFCETFFFYALIKKTTGKRKFFLSYRLASVGKYYDFITPTQLGGQPSQIIRLTQSGISAGLSTSIPIIKLIVYNFVYTFISLVLYVFVVPLIPTVGGLQTFLMAIIRILGAVGLTVTIISCFLYFIIGNGKLIGRSFVQWLVRAGYKLHIVKNYRKTFDRLLTQVKEYQSSIKYLNKNKGTLFVTVILSTIECIAFGLIPFCVVMAFSSVTFASGLDVFTCMLITMCEYYLCLMVATCLPLPGGTGTMEICFIFLFAIGAYSVGDNIAWALILFRVISYYIVLVNGFIHIIIENIAKIASRNKLSKNSENAQPESASAEM